MAVRYAGFIDTAAGAQFQAGRAQVVAAASGGTLAGSQIVQIVFDDTKFSNANGDVGKQKLICAVQEILAFLTAARSWPIDTTS
jgi:hypothetical protein